MNKQKRIKKRKLLKTTSHPAVPKSQGYFFCQDNFLLPSWVKKFVELAQFWQFLVKPSRNFELCEENQLSWPQNRLDNLNGLELKTEKITQQISDLLISQGIASHQSENCCTSKDWLCPWKSKPIGIITYKKCHLCSKIIWQGKCDQYLCVFVTRIHPCNKKIQNYK